MKTTLVTTYYNEKVKERHDELLTCIRTNISVKGIDRLVIIIDEGTVIPFRHPKVVWKVQAERPTYNDFFNTANEYDSPIKIIANTDIYFDEYNLGIVKASIKDNECYALSRWDMQVSGDCVHHCSRDSQDVWIFKGKIKTMVSSFKSGVCGCDNRIAHEISEAGYEVINPSKTIKTFHLHITGIRNYRRVEGQIVPKPYKLIQPTYLGERIRTDVTIDVHGKIVKTEIEPVEVKLTEFDYAKQKAQMEAILKEGNIPNRFLLTICIPTMHERKVQYKELHKELMRQMIKHRLTTKIEIKELLDDGYAPIGWKRNKLNIECNGRYVAHFDDDDFPHEDYCIDLVNAIEGNYGVDVITFNSILTTNGEREERMLYHQKYTGNHRYEDADNKVFYRERMPSHLNAIRRECALQHAFQVHTKKEAKNRSERNDFGSDVHYSLDMVRDKTLKTFFHIDKDLYYYRYKNKKP